jgi:phosphocarrier protein HPr
MSAMVKSDRGLYRDVIIINALGLHARSATKIAKRAQNSKSKVWIIKDGAKADASSIFDILTLACGQGSEITIKIEDQLDREILDDLVKLVESGFGE